MKVSSPRRPAALITSFTFLLMCVRSGLPGEGHVGQGMVIVITIRIEQTEAGEPTKKLGCATLENTAGRAIYGDYKIHVIELGRKPWDR